jgi:hypothetical protein
MQFVAPIKFEAAIQKLGARSPIGAQLSSQQWSAVPVALRERALWSATIESLRFLQDTQNDLTDFLAANRDPETGALKVGSRAKFIENIRRSAIAQGLGPIDPEDVGTIKDITSEKRLGLMFDVNTRAARGFGDRKQGMDPDVLNEFPAQRFIRVQEVKTERESHIPFEGQVALKTDLAFWLRINQDFGVPWAPWGWGCGHDVEDVDRTESDALGLTKPTEQLAGGDEDFNEHLQASVKNLEPEMIRFLRESFGNQIKIENGFAQWTPAAPSILPPPSVGSNVTRLRDCASAEDNSLATSWLQDFDSLSTQYNSASYTAKTALREQARQIISVPESIRAGVAIENVSRPSGRQVQTIADAGNNTIAQFVRPDLAAKTKVQLFHTSDDRAFYRPDQKAVYLNVNSDLATAAHEIMHGIEVQNPAVLNAAANFLLERRRAGKFGLPEQPQSLRSLTGLPYSGSEIAIEDDWIARGGRVYAGKVYLKPGRSSVLSTADGPAASDLAATEVLTIGIERLLADPIDFYQRDPEWFHFMVETVGIGKSL